MAEIPVAIGLGWAISPVISLILTKTTTYIENKFFKKAGIEDNMKKMKTTLTEVLSVMGVVEKQKIQDLNQAQLVQEIKDAVYDAEDIMDEFEYYLLQKNSQEHKNKVVQVASSSCCVIRNFIGSYNFKKKVEEVIKNLDQAKGLAKILLELMNVTSSNVIPSCDHENDFVTSSSIIDEFFGRKSELKQIKDLLFDQTDKLPTVIPIVGQGGIGKTTLAQKIYNDPTVERKFDFMLWIYVSENFDKIKLTKDMVQHVCRTSTENLNLNVLQSKLEEKFNRKKVLLVLDDVWYNKDSKDQQYSYSKEWKEILTPLKKAKRSKIILTTREKLVGMLLGSIESINLEGLNEEDSWSLFQFCAFGGENQDQRRNLEPIGKKIVNILNGSALAIKVVGMRLKEINDVEEWETILNENPSNTSDIMNILLRSYEHLPVHLKRCFAYCSLFPKGNNLESSLLVPMWIALGFVRSKEKLEDVGASYLKELLARSFFQVRKRGDEKYFVLHDLMHDLASHVSKNECCLLKENTMKELGSIRHLSVTPKTIDVLRNMINSLDKVRTLLFLDFSVGDPGRKLIEEVVIKLKRIRVTRYPNQSSKAASCISKFV